MDRVSGNLDDRDLTAPLPGRALEQAELQRLLGQIQNGFRGNEVLVSGEAGIGKTTLVERLSHYAGAAGTLVVANGCNSLTMGQPFAPWQEILTIPLHITHRSRFLRFPVRGTARQPP